MRQPNLITFDLDGTLLDDSAWEPTIVRACERLGREMRFDPARLIAANTEVWAEFWPTVEDDWTLGVRDGDSITREADESGSGPASLMVIDPDGNPILLDHHV